VSLAAQVAAGVTAAFAGLGDLVQTVTLRRSTLGGYDANGSTVAETTADYPFQGAVTKRETTVEGGISRTVLTVALKPGGVEPVPGDHLVIGTETVRVMAVEAIQPGAEALAFTVKAE
jgi:hypothetical protein